jgi:hypothetical protein
MGYRTMKKFVFALLLLFASPVFAQWQTPNHSIPTGRGVGVTGFGAAVPGTVGLPLISAGPTFDPVFQSLANVGLTPGANNTIKCTLTGAVQDCTASQVNTILAAGAGSVIAPSKINNTCYVDGVGFVNLAAAIAACAANSTIIVPSNQTISAVLSVTGAYVVIHCENGAVLSIGTAGGITFGNGSAVVSGSGIENCTLAGSGNGTTQTTFPLWFEGPAGSTMLYNVFRNNRISGFGSTGDAGTVSMQNVSYLEAYGNVLQGNRDNGIQISTTGAGGTSSHNSITDNYIGNGIVFIPAASAGATDWTISDNRLDIGSGGATGATGAGCIQILGGNTPIVGVAMKGNNCHLEGNITIGGPNAYAIAGLFNCTFSGNTYRRNGFSFTSGSQFLFEFNQMGNCLVDGNQAESTNENGYVFENVNLMTVSNNTLNGTGTGLVGFSFLSTAGTSGIRATTVTGNSLSITGAGSFGMFFTCNFSGALCSDIVVSGNRITGDASGSQQGIVFQAGVGSMSNILVGPNAIRAMAFGVNIGSGVTADCLLPGANYAITPVTNSGAASVCN